MKACRLCLALLVCLSAWHPPTEALECDGYKARLPEARVEARQATHSAAFARLDELVYRSNFHLSMYLYREEAALLSDIAKSLEPHLPPHAGVNSFRFIVLEPDETYSDAGVLPSGLIVFSVETIHASPSIDALAAIVAHEIAHLALGHLAGDGVVMKSVTSEYLTLAHERQTVSDPERVRLLERRAISLLSEMVSRNVLWQHMEFEADAFAAHVVRNAGYDTSAIAQVLRENVGTDVDVRDNLHPRATLRAELFSCFAQAPNHEKNRELEARLVELRKRGRLTQLPRQ